MKLEFAHPHLNVLGTSIFEQFVVVCYFRNVPQKHVCLFWKQIRKEVSLEYCIVEKDLHHGRGESKMYLPVFFLLQRPNAAQDKEASDFLTFQQVEKKVNSL